MPAGGVQPRDDAPRLVRPGRVGGDECAGARAPVSGWSGCARTAGSAGTRVRGPSRPVHPRCLVVQPRRRRLTALLLGGLGGDAGPGVGLGESAVLDEPVNPDLGIGVHETTSGNIGAIRDSTSSGMSSTTTASSRPRRGARSGGAPRADGRCLERLAFVLVAEHDRRQRRAVQGAVGLQECAPNSSTSLASPGCRAGRPRARSRPHRRPPTALRERAGHRDLPAPIPPVNPIRASFDSSETKPRRKPEDVLRDPISTGDS